MLNAEKHKESIEEFNYGFGITKEDKLIPCIAANCHNSHCKFHSNQSCARARIQWLLEEAPAQTHEAILELLAETNGVFAVNKRTGEVFRCENFTNCGNCTFADSNRRCEENRYQWLVQHNFIN